MRRLLSAIGIILLWTDAQCAAFSPIHATTLWIPTKRQVSRPFSSTTSSVSLSLSPLQPGPFAVAAILPSCLGFWRTGYTVSYGYGGAMLTAGLVQLYTHWNSIHHKNPLLLTPLLSAHALPYVFYGLRLCGFLLNRERKQPEEIHQMKRRDATTMERIKRLPVILGCSGLYYLMAAAPMKVLSKTTISSNTATANTVPSLLFLATAFLGLGGFLLAAVGDWYKSHIKARDGPDKLVTTGPFRFLRHPNYTGEMIGWTCSCLLLPLVQVISCNPNSRQALLPWLVASGVGWAGMVLGVLMAEATPGLEKKQKKKYGNMPEYKEWTRTAWAGPMLDFTSSSSAGADDNAKTDKA